MRQSRMILAVTSLVLCLIFGLPSSSRSCSTFLLKDGKVLLFGRNLDFFLKGGYVMTNPRNMVKAALLDQSQNPAKWISKYGSITFTQVSKEYPYGGMNEAGLVVENMSLENTQYPAPDGRAAVSELQWIQFQLDNCANVDEVLASDSSIRIAPGSQLLHFLVADRAGNAAVIEFLDGKMVAHAGAGLIVSALTNNAYDESLDYLALHEGFGGEKKIARTYESLDRFANVVSMLGDRRAVRRGTAVRHAFNILDAVATGDGTVWSIVYDMRRMRIMFKSVVNKDIRTVRMNDFDFDCMVASRVLAIDGPGKGNIAAKFEEYTTELNLALVRNTFARFREVNLTDLSESAQEYLARYPEKLVCSGASPSEENASGGAARPRDNR